MLHGDETWLRLFPDAFSRSDPTSGFFTKDTIVVDTNVSRHLPEDLDPLAIHERSRDWDVLILHYLGLDHVGHQHGPTRHMHAKLLEMDAALERIHTSLTAQNIGPALLVVASDHGMNAAGNHGGASLPEASAFVAFIRDNTDAKVLMSAAIKDSKTLKCSVPRGCRLTFFRQ